MSFSSGIELETAYDTPIFPEDVRIVWVDSWTGGDYQIADTYRSYFFGEPHQLKRSNYSARKVFKTRYLFPLFAPMPPTEFYYLGERPWNLKIIHHLSKTAEIEWITSDNFYYGPVSAMWNNENLPANSELTLERFLNGHLARIRRK